MKTNISAVSILGVLAAAACAKHGGANAGAESAVPSCEINYSVLPHKNAVERLGNDRLSALETIRETFDREQQFIESFDDLANDVFAVFEIEGENSDQISIKTVFGGYEGFTSPSLNIELNLTETASRDNLTKAAAALGYVFVQDSVLVQCTPEEGDSHLVTSFEITETGRVDALNTESLKSIYGMMIGEAGGDLKLGFSYYPYQDRFSVLGFVEDGDRDREVIRRVSKNISDLTDGSHSITVTENLRWVQFPSNDWSEFPLGGDYAKNRWSKAEREMLDAIQKRFVGRVDAYVQRDEE